MQVKTYKSKHNYGGRVWNNNSTTSKIFVGKYVNQFRSNPKMSTLTFQINMQANLDYKVTLS